MDLKLRTAADAIDAGMRNHPYGGSPRLSAWLSGAPITSDSLKTLWRIFSAISVAEERHPEHYLQADYRGVACISLVLPALKEHMLHEDLVAFVEKYNVGREKLDVDDPLGLGELV